MARLIPKMIVKDIALKPERDTAKFLVDGLPDNVVVYHSYPWLRSERNDKNGKVTIREGEADFVVVIPELGFLVIEVKGGVIEYDQKEGRWYRKLNQGKRREIKDPFKQASGNTHEIKKRITDHAFPQLKYPPCAFGYAVIFPDCDYQGTVAPGSDSAIILSTKDLPYLDRRIPEILKKWCPSNPSPMTKEQLKCIRRALTSTFSLIPILSRQIDEEEESLVRLTDEQFRLLGFLQSHYRCSIEGVAGSGKTLLALEQAKHFAKQGFHTLLVCYNKTLAQWIRNSLPPEGSFIDVYHFHGLCHLLCKEAGIPFSPPNKNKSKFFDSVAPNLLLDAVAILGTKYDALVVDEGQDFNSDWWLPLEALCHQEDKAPFFLFYDPAQKLFVEKIGLPNLGHPYTLNINCRNTRSIASKCASIRNMDIQVQDSAPTGMDVEMFICESEEEQKKKCESILKEIKKGGLRSDQIVIQSPFREPTLFSSNKIAGFTIVRDIQKWKDGHGILYTTIRNFKGLEADAVIMVDLPEPNESSVFSLNDFYVGASRAKHFLAVLARSPRVIDAMKKNLVSDG